jgi:hypothetical protein
MRLCAFFRKRLYLFQSRGLERFPWLLGFFFFFVLLR